MMILLSMVVTMILLISTVATSILLKRGNKLAQNGYDLSKTREEITK